MEGYRFKGSTAFTLISTTFLQESNKIKNKLCQKEAAEANKTQQAITEIMSQIQALKALNLDLKEEVNSLKGKLTEPAQTETTEIATKKRSDLKEGLFKPRGRSKEKDEKQKQRAKSLPPGLNKNS